MEAIREVNSATSKNFIRSGKYKNNKAFHVLISYSLSTDRDLVVGALMFKYEYQ